MVIAALPDEHLEKTRLAVPSRSSSLTPTLTSVLIGRLELARKFPECEFRAVAVSFAPGAEYLEKIVDATKDIDVQLIFNNAGRC